MTVLKRISLLLPVLLAAFALSMIATSATYAAGTGPGECPETPDNPTGTCPQAEQRVELPASAPAPTPTPVDACPEVEGMQTDSSQCLPDEAPAPGLDIETTSLTLQGVQHDPPATVGGEQTIMPISAVTSVSGGGAVSTPTGSLPYTGMSVFQVAILGSLLTMLGVAGWAIGTRRTRTETA